MKLEKIRFRLTGAAPMLMRNGDLADPANYFSKEMRKISAVRNKTDADHAALARLEFLGGLYLNEKGRVVVAGKCVEAMLKTAAKARKLGKAFDSAVFCEEDHLLKFPGPQEPEAMWASGKFHLKSAVTIERRRVMRTRPKFDKWSVDIEVSYIPEVVEASSVVEAINRAGLLVGLSNWRPKYGRFLVKQL